MKSFMRSMPPVSSKLAVSASRSSPTGLGLLAEPRRSWISGRALDQRRPAELERVAEAREGSRAPLGETCPAPRIRRPRSGAAAPRSAEDRRALVGEPLEVGHQRPQLAQEGRQPVDAAADVVAALGGGLRGLVGLDDEVGDTCSRSRASGAERRVGVARQPREHAVLAGQDREHLVGLAQRRVGAVDDLVELLAAAGEAGAELVEQDREALAVGQAHDVVDQVEVDRRARVRRPAAGARPRRRPRRSARSGCAERGAGLALHELLADQRLRADRAVGVGLERREVLVVDPQRHRGLLVLGHVERPDRRRPARRRPSRPRPRRASEALSKIARTK